MIARLCACLMAALRTHLSPLWRRSIMIPRGDDE